MAATRPYQPLLLRLVHGAIAVLGILALVTGFGVYNTYDGRWGRLPLPKIASIQDLHGTIALTFLLVLPLFVIYCFHGGYRRLIQPDSLSQLKQIGKPLGWIALQRCFNTLMLCAATFAVITGRMMKEEWLPQGEINHAWYLAHLTAWLIVLISLACHLLMGIKMGGVPLLLSMISLQKRLDDNPKIWLRELVLNPPSLLLNILEGLVIGGILLAFLLPVFNA